MYATTIDLRDLADELDTLREQAVTCGTCKGEGYIERTATQEDVDNDPEYVKLGAPQNDYCDVCDGDGEYVPADDDERLRDLPADDADRLRALIELEDELGSDLRYHGENLEPTMVREDEFVAYAQELAEEIGAIPPDNQWPLYCIDWERAARELRVDYTSITFDGIDYLIRSS